MHPMVDAGRLEFSKEGGICLLLPACLLFCLNRFEKPHVGLPRLTWGIGFDRGGLTCAVLPAFYSVFCSIFPLLRNISPMFLQSPSPGSCTAQHLPAFNQWLLLPLQCRSDGTHLPTGTVFSRWHKHAWQVCNT